jgi:organic hydroperoxide reductase OsmC/OhrA
MNFNIVTEMMCLGDSWDGAHSLAHVKEVLPLKSPNNPEQLIRRNYSGSFCIVLVSFKKQQKIDH